MSLVSWMAGGSLLSWLIASAALGVRSGRVDILLGMLAPLLATSVSWLLMERTHARDPRQLTRAMVKAFASKMIFFGLYLAWMLKLTSVSPRLFAISFACYLIVLYLVEALWLWRLLSPAPPLPRRVPR
jgi:hypothetical protein